MAGGGGSGSVRGMNDTIKANREALKTSDHNQSYLKANSIKNNRKSNVKHLISGGIGLALTCIALWFGSIVISNYTAYENEQYLKETPIPEPQDSTWYTSYITVAEKKMELGKYEEALIQYENALKIFPEDSIANAGLFKAARQAFN